MNSLTEAKDVLSVISQHNSKRSVPATIHTFGLIDGELELQLLFWSPYASC